MAPRPNQLGPNKSTEAAWYSKFEKFLTECQDHYFANSEYPAQFRVESYQGLPPQRDFRDDLLEFIRRDKTAYRHQMAKWAYSKRLIPYQDIATLIPEGGRKFELLQLGAGLADGSHGFAEPSMYVAPAEFELLPSCYAVPFAQDLATEQCAGCPLAGACKGDALWVALKSDMNISSSAPQKDHARKLTRARVARHRERLRGE